MFFTKGFETINKIKDFNYKNIYLSERIQPSNSYFKLIINEIYNTLKNTFDKENTLEKIKFMEKTYPKVIGNFKEWLENYWNLERNEKLKNDILFDISNEKDYSSAIILYIAGMTDNFAIETYQNIVGFLKGVKMANLELYKIFVEVAKEQNITRASQNLNISQPAVTRHIKNLENELNIVLFNRTKRNGINTEIGQKLFEEISPVIEKIVEIDNKYSGLSEIRLGTYATMLSKVLSNSIAEFYSKNENAKIITITDNSKVLNFPLNGGDLDIAVLRKYNEDEYDSNKYKYISLGNFDFVLIANNKSNLCNKNKIKISDLKNKIIYMPRGENNSTNSFF